MTRLLTLITILFSYHAMADYDLVCSGKKCFHSPYPNGGSCSSFFLSVDLEGDHAQYRKNRKKVADIILDSVIQNHHTGEVEILGKSYELENIELLLNINGPKGPSLTGKIGSTNIDFRCNKNFVIDL